jgi:NAD(P)-dependent dehydrogenase (short-subunit alcohol dehydrogenase family)
MTERTTDLAEKIALVTGASQGIGRACALTLAAQGATVAVAARNEEKLRVVAEEIVSAGGKAEVFVLDISNETSIKDTAKAVIAKLGRVDILVNNAGITGPTAMLWEVTPAEWEETFAVNVTGPYLCCRAFLPSMIERHAGSIIFISSMTGKRPLVGRATYAAGKMALVGLARTLAWETGPYGIRVNVISPGAVEGERVERVIREQARVEGISLEESRRHFTGNSPLGRMVPSQNIADAVLFLASDRAASITGEDLNVSAGTVMY